MNDSVLTLDNVGKKFSLSNGELTILENVSFKVKQGETVSIVGPSGSGKTTLLGLCAGLDNSSEGKIELINNDLTKLTEDNKAKIRNQHIGFVFQNFQLIPTLTALENIMVPLELIGDKTAKKKALYHIEQVGLLDRKSHYPTQLSGGEQQRVAIARAFINNPKVLFADEPTGNLDDETSKSIENLLFDLNKKFNTTLILVTHDLELAKKTHRIIRLKSGKIASDELTNSENVA